MVTLTSLIITGHSLGAATAELVTLQLLHQKKTLCSSIHCVALAPPPVYRSTTPLPPETSEHITCYINGQDCVPRMSLGSVAWLLAALRAVDALKISPVEHLELLTGITASGEEGKKKAEENLELLEETVKSIQQDRFPFLEHPGKIKYLCPRAAQEKAGEQKYLVVKQPSTVFSKKLALSERMILDHLELNYRYAFKLAMGLADE